MKSYKNIIERKILQSFLIIRIKKKLIAWHFFKKILKKFHKTNQNIIFLSELKKKQKILIKWLMHI